MKTFALLWLFLAHYFSESEICRTNVATKENTHFLLIAFLLENHAFSEAVWKIGVDTDRQIRFRERPRYYASTYIASLFLYWIPWFITKMRPQNTNFRDYKWRREVYTSWLFLPRFTSTRTVHVVLFVVLSCRPIFRTVTWFAVASLVTEIPI
jgi:hypothetical protein